MGWLDSATKVYDSAKSGDVAGVADTLAGSTDESIARQFDDESGGGFLDSGTWVSAGDDLSGSVDESIGRQFDDSPGGGIVDLQPQDPLADMYEYPDGEVPGSSSDAVLDETDSGSIGDDTKAALGELFGGDDTPDGPDYDGDGSADFSVSDPDASAIPTISWADDSGGGSSGETSTTSTGGLGDRVGLLLAAVVAVIGALVLGGRSD